MQTLHEPKMDAPTRLRVTQVQLLHPEEPVTLLPEAKRQKSQRIVSKGAYVANVGKKAALSSGGMSLYLLGLLGLAVSFVVLTILCTDRLLRQPLEIVIVSVIAALSAGTFFVGRRTLQKGVTLDPRLPFTSANAAHLPATESLVRASSEPAQEHEAVLLRAVPEGQEKHEEQLLRAAAGGRE